MEASVDDSSTIQNEVKPGFDDHSIHVGGAIGGGDMFASTLVFLGVVVGL